MGAPIRGLFLDSSWLIGNAFYELGPGLPWLLCSYHPSRQNTQTGRLTEPMFDDIWQKVKLLMKVSE